MAVERQTETRRYAQDWSPDWRESILAEITEAGLEAAQAKLDAGKADPAMPYVEVAVTMRVKVQLPVGADRKAMWSDAGVLCYCYRPQPGVCVCRGPGAGDKSCDCEPKPLKPIA